MTSLEVVCDRWLQLRFKCRNISITGISQRFQDHQEIGLFKKIDYCDHQEIDIL